jgi:hypothetical protein
MARPGWGHPIAPARCRLVSDGGAHADPGMRHPRLPRHCGAQPSHLWQHGLALQTTDVPTALKPTTDDEITQDYLSVVGLEPETLSAVVASGGADPERLTLMGKALGIQSHKGGVVILPGDARDMCVTSWLAGADPSTACTAALTLP